MVGGKPLIAWTIEAARGAKSVERVVVTTDCPGIVEVSRRHGAEVPFMRPAELATDDAPGILPAIHAVEWLEENENYQPDYVAYLQPTSPLRTAEDIDNAMRLAEEKRADGVVSVTEAGQHPLWMKTIDAEGRMADFLPQRQEVVRRQDLPPVYGLNGAIYLVRRDVLLTQRTFYNDRTFPYVMPSERSLDIDTPWDLFLVGLILDHRRRDEDNHSDC